jgi:dTDP-4-dehydrorhamnose reductase
MRRILITGSKGQLGTSLQEILRQDEVYGIDLPELDLVSFNDTMKKVKEVNPDIVIHCAAKTQVDDCELKPEDAYAANVLATRNLVNACQAVDATIVYISTDYVFDGKNNRPYQEYDRCNPQSVYGMTKWQGEEIVKTHLNKFYIIRTAWLFGDIGNNFVRTVLRLAENQNTINIVNDQFGSPTYALDLAVIIERLIQTGAYGIYHGTNEGNCTWFDFTKDILALAGKENVIVKPITTAELNRPAPRPMYSVLGKDSLHALGVKAPSYQDALLRFFKKNKLGYL